MKSYEERQEADTALKNQIDIQEKTLVRRDHWNCNLKNVN